MPAARRAGRAGGRRRSCSRALGVAASVAVLRRARQPAGAVPVARASRPGSRRVLLRAARPDGRLASQRHRRGARAASSPDWRSPTRQREWQRAAQRRDIVWEAEGVESSVALTHVDGYAFIVNGKIDGNAAHRRAHPGDGRAARRAAPPEPAARPGDRPGHRQHGGLARRGARRSSAWTWSSSSPPSCASRRDCAPVNERRPRQPQGPRHRSATRARSLLTTPRALRRHAALRGSRPRGRATDHAPGTRRPRRALHAGHR